MSAPMISEYDGLRFIFDFFPLDPSDNVRFLDPKDTADPARLMTIHFREVSRHFNYTVLPSESIINNWGNTMLDNGCPNKALNLYLLNVNNYPASPGAWESLGDFYTATGNKEKAIECYHRALTIKNTPEIKAKMKKLNGGG